MTEETQQRRSLLRPVLRRSREESHRAATPLELLFDLCFVVAIAVLAAGLHHGLADGHALSGVIGYVALFIPIWWAWMSYTWYATAFDNDDLLFRLLTLAQMGGVLVLAASLPAALDGNFVPFTLAYTAMRLPLIAQWLRAALDDKEHRAFALRYVYGIIGAQSLWLIALAFPMPVRIGVWVLALTADLLTPVWATRVAPVRAFHAGHIAERYGLFTLIVLGETILAVSIGARDVIAAGSLDLVTITLCAAALITAFAIWWLYFDTLGREALERHRRAAFIWGYGHALLYASIAAIGAGVQAQVENPSAPGAGWFTAVPTALVLLSLAWLQQSANVKARSALLLSVLAAAVLAIAAIGHSSPAIIAVVSAALVVVAVTTETLRARPT